MACQQCGNQLRAWNTWDTLVTCESQNYELCREKPDNRENLHYKKDLPPHLGRQSQDFIETGTFLWTILMGDVFDQPLHMLLEVF